MRLAFILLLASGLALAQSADTESFEVASVRPHQGDAIHAGSLSVTSPLVRLEGYTVFGLVMDAYHLRDYQLQFGSAAPKEDIYGTMYDIVARAPNGRVPSVDSVRAMLRHLLAERFQLSAHIEAKRMDGYFLEAAKGRPAALKPSSTDAPCSIRTSLATDARNDEDIFANCSMDEIAGRFSFLLSRPVFDRTGLKGQYDFRLLYTPEYRARGESTSVDVSPSSAISDLGLKTVPAKTDVAKLVIDRLQKPSGN
jgi:uncharacterized protein (TIGR03435 family)